MSSSPPKMPVRLRTSLRALVLPIALLLPLAVVGVAATLALSGGEGSPPPVAGGAFHPVAGGFVPDAREIDECGDDQACLQQAFGNVSYREGPRVALARFEERLATDPAVGRGCHQIAHLIGSGALARYRGDVARTFAEGSSACASGYYHGVLDRAFAGVTSRRELAETATRLCEGASLRRRSFLDYQCRHGLGHGLMIQTGYDLPLALSLCAAQATPWDRSACASGVFMENVDTRFGFRSRWLSDDDPAVPCRQVAARVRPSCYVRAATRLAQLEGAAPRVVARGCGRLGERWAPYCLRGLGRDLVGAGRIPSTNAAIVAGCRLAGGGAPECLYGAARALADALGERGLARAGALCRALGGDERRRCVAGLGVVVGLLGVGDGARRDTCRRLAAPEVEACARSAREAVDPATWSAWS